MVMVMVVPAGYQHPAPHLSQLGSHSQRRSERGLVDFLRNTNYVANMKSEHFI
jgi:hypothetical protein